MELGEILLQNLRDAGEVFPEDTDRFWVEINRSQDAEPRALHAQAEAAAAAK